jgi:SAM-dependent methyltransferase
MRFLREKEFGAGGPEVYRSRGHSSDTSLAPAYSVWHALAIIAGLEKSALFNRVLLIGPGVDFAARTGFRDAVPPQSYQPLLTAHSMLQHRLSDPGRLAVTCVDVNPRVLAFALLRNQVTLPAETGNKAFTEWLRDLGPTLQVEQPVYENMRCRQLNIITERIADETFDIVIATNVLLYFDDVELPLSLANIAAMLRPGGYFVHNELRPDVEVIARALKLPMIQGRTIDIATGARRALRDAIVIHQKKR